MDTPIILINAPARRVLAHLRHGPMTVDELANAMRLTPNAVRNQLSKLREAALVERKGTRRGISRPSAVYSITLEGQTQFSTIYLPVLTRFLLITEKRCSPAQLDSVMRETGKSLAERYPKAKGTYRQRVNDAARLLKSFGALPEVVDTNGLEIRSIACPLAALTLDNAAACGILEGLLTEHVGSRATSCCVHEPEPRCCFQIRK